jgi:hypothetical protein
LTRFTVDDAYGDRHGDEGIVLERAAVIEQCRRHAVIGLSNRFRREPAHRVPEHADAVENQAVMHRTARIAVLVLQPIDRRRHQHRVARRFSNTNGDEPLRGHTRQEL